MNDDPPNTPDTPESSPPTPPGSLDQIRDILFGQAQRGFEDRFARLEQRLSDDLSAALRSVHEDAAALEQSFRERLEAAAEHRSELQHQQQADVSRLTDDQRHATERLEQRIADLQNQLQELLRETREHLEQQIQDLRQETRHEAEQQRQQLLAEIQKLQEAKADRSAIRQIFLQAAEALAGGGDS